MRYGSVLAGLAIIGVGVAGWYWFKEGPPSQAPGGFGGKRAAFKGNPNAPVPVSVEPVRQETVPLYREGIGNVQALSTVTVRSQIDGRLIAVEFTEGQMVKKGDVLARIDPAIYKAQYDQAVAKKAQDMASLANARIDLQRYQRLAQSNAGSQQQADQQAAQVTQLEAQVAADQAAIDNAKAYLDYTVIHAPIDGRAGLRQVDPGNVIHASDSSGLVSITQLDPIAVVFTLPQRDLPVVNAALARGTVPVEVLEAGGKGVLAAGQLQTIDNQIDTTTGTIKLKAVLPNDTRVLWPGQFVSARVVVDTLKGVTVVPTPAVRRGPIGTFVYAVGEGKAVLRSIEVVSQDETRAVVKGAIAPGDSVVTVGFAQLSDGRAVRISGGPAAMPGKDRAGQRKDGAPEANGTEEGAGKGKRPRREATQ
ncbi:MAG: efflux RND transporter periplasmic adaptor subunit [Hyphomicrobiaceae bacterium]|nr:efflux RND transporter periplasmic adaptor subunit [Hyphomicrobiaceae bacterium]